MQPSDLDPPQLALLALTVAAVASVVLVTGGSGATFGIYNGDWDGSSELRDIAAEEGLERQIVYDTRQYERDPDGQTVAVVLSPDDGYSRQEAERIRAFVLNGGTLVVAEDFGTHSNDLLRSVGATARVDGALLRDEWQYFQRPTMPRVTQFDDRGRFRGVGPVVLNYGTAVVPGEASVLARSASSAYLDRNLNGSLDNSESVRSYPVVTTERFGQGTVIVVSDPSIFINTMLGRPNNRAFVRALLTPYDNVLIDYSNAQSRPPLFWFVLSLVQSSPTIQFALTGGGLSVVGLWSVRQRLVRVTKGLLGAT